MQAVQTTPNAKVVFVCDDDEDIAEVTRFILQRSHYDVKVFSVCEGILEAAKKYRPSLILLDLWMPDMGGEKVIRLLKTDPETSNIPVYIFSATRNVEAVVKRSGANGFLNKPYNINDLDELVKKVIK